MANSQTTQNVRPAKYKRFAVIPITHTQIEKRSGQKFGSRQPILLLIRTSDYNVASMIINRYKAIVHT